MKTTVFKRVFTLLMALILFASAMPFLVPPVSAATSSSVASKLSANLPIVTYAMPLSGASRVYSYSSSSLSCKTTGYYIDTYTDQIVITKISSNGKAVYVTYPSSSSSTGYRSRWFATDDILGIASVNVQSYTASAKSTTYRMSDSSRVTSYGSIARNDCCISLGSHTVGGKTYYPTIYPISSGRYNGVSGVKHKLALATSVPTTSASTQNMSYALYKSSGGKLTCGFDGYVNTIGRHEGIDFKKGYGSAVYSLTDGVITRVTEGYNGSNGLSTIAIYSASTGKTVIYLHADPLNSLYVGQTISRGQQIATEAWRGCSSSSGTHTHVEVRDGRRTAAAKSVNDYTLDNSNPTAFWNGQGYLVK